MNAPIQLRDACDELLPFLQDFLILIYSVLDTQSATITEVVIGPIRARADSVGICKPLIAELSFK